MTTDSLNSGAPDDLGSSTPRSRRSWLSLLIGILSSVLFGWLAVRGVSWSDARDALGNVRWGWVAAYVVGACGIQGLRMLRWSLLVHALGETRWRRTLSIGAVGLSAIFFFPARLGEVVRPVLIAEAGRVTTGEAIATVVVERLIDGIMVGLMLVGVGIWVNDALPGAATIRSAGFTVGGIFLGLTVGVLLAVLFIDLFNRTVDALIGRWSGIASRTKGLVVNFRDGLVTLSQTHHVPAYLAITTLMWIANGLAILLLFAAFGFDLPLPCAFVVLSATAVGILVPAAPTSVGTIHFAVIWALGLYNVGEAVAFNFAVVFHLGQVTSNLLIGIGGITTGGMTLGRLRGGVAAAERRRTHRAADAADVSRPEG